AHNQSLPVGLEQCEIQADFDHVFLDRTTRDVSGRLSLCSVIEKILKKICICQKPRIPGKKGFKDWQDPVERKNALSLNQERKDARIGRILFILLSFLSWFKTNWLIIFLLDVAYSECRTSY